MRSTVRFIVGATLLGAVGVAATEPQREGFRGDEELRQYQRLGSQLIEDGDVASRLIAALSRDDRRALGTTTLAVAFTRNPYRLVSVRETSARGRAIEIGSAFVAEVDIASDATVIAGEKSRDRDLIQFAKRYVATLRESWSGRSAPGSSVRAQSFSDYIGWSRADHEAFRATRAYQAMRTRVNDQTLAWVSAHFIGHEVLAERSADTGDLPGREQRIDAFATQLAFDAGFAPTPPLIGAMLFASLEDPRQPRPDGALCRATQIVSNGLRLSKTDSQAMRRMGIAKPAAASIADQHAELERIRLATGCIEPH